MWPAAQGLDGPCRQAFRILNDVYGHFIVGFERLLGIGAERRHPLRKIHRDSVGRDFEVQPSLINNPEERALGIESIAAKHFS